MKKDEVKKLKTRMTVSVILIALLATMVCADTVLILLKLFKVI